MRRTSIDHKRGDDANERDETAELIHHERDDEGPRRVKQSLEIEQVFIPLTTAPSFTFRRWITKQENTGIPLNALLFSSALAAIVLILTKPPNSASSVVDFYEQDNAPTSYVSSRVELSLRNIKHWCLNGEDNSCDCTNPLDAQPRYEKKGFRRAHELNVENAKQVERELDVVFLGDSITENWRGTSYGEVNDKKVPNIKVYNKLFTKEGGGEFDGLTLGISGDKVRDVYKIA